MVNSSEDCSFFRMSESSVWHFMYVWMVIEGVLMFLVALRISLMRGTPKVTFLAEIPAVWKVLLI